MPSSAEELLTPEKGHRRKRKKTKSRRSSVNVVELGEEARSSPGEEPPRKGKKRSGCSASPDKVILAKNVVKKHGEVVLLWTRDDDRLILSEVQRHGPSPDIFSSVAALLGDKTGSQVSRRFRELLKLFQKAAAAERLTNEAFAKLQSDSDAMQESDHGSSPPPPAAHAPRC
uniref:CASP8-associated protein 2 n=1 Tax=Petromyzon marinus TaxID=7757 RepID=A0AAJ7UA66_PETMA|nr:CASP8-associated protein 2-like [Petromyzon marinus]